MLSQHEPLPPQLDQQQYYQRITADTTPAQLEAVTAAKATVPLPCSSCNTSTPQQVEQIQYIAQLFAR